MAMSEWELRILSVQNIIELCGAYLDVDRTSASSQTPLPEQPIAGTVLRVADREEQPATPSRLRSQTVSASTAASPPAPVPAGDASVAPPAEGGMDAPAIERGEAAKA